MNQSFLIVFGKGRETLLYFSVPKKALKASMKVVEGYRGVVYRKKKCSQVAHPS